MITYRIYYDGELLAVALSKQMCLDWIAFAAQQAADAQCIVMTLL